MPVLLGLLILPIVEIWLLIVIGGEIGAWATIAWILLSGALGAALLRSQGAAAMARMRAALNGGAPDGEALAGELFDGLAILLAGIFLIMPGFLTDTIGLLLFVPPLRRAIGRALWAWLHGSERVRVYAASGRGPFGSAGRATIIEGEFSEVKAPENPRDPGQNQLPR